MTNDPCQTLLFGPPPNYMDVCGEPAVGRWRRERRCRKHLLEMEANTCGEAANVRWDMDPAQGPLFWLCLPLVLAYLAGKIAWAWVRTKMPSRPAWLHCRDCGWGLPPNTVSLICNVCQEQRRRAAADCRICSRVLPGVIYVGEDKSWCFKRCPNGCVTPPNKSWGSYAVPSYTKEQFQVLLDSR